MEDSLTQSSSIERELIDDKESFKVIQLRTKNKQLIEQINSLKKQFDQVCIFSNENEELTKKNAMLENIIRTEKARYDELLRRFEIVTSECPQQDLGRDEHSNMLKEEIKATIHKLDEERKRYSEQVKELNNDIHEKNTLLSKSRMENDTLTGYINAIYKAAQEKFNVVFNSPGELISFIQNYSVSENSSSSLVHNQQQNEIVELKKLLKDMKKRLQKEKKIKDDMVKKQAEDLGLMREKEDALMKRIAEVEGKQTYSDIELSKKDNYIKKLKEQIEEYKTFQQKFLDLEAKVQSDKATYKGVFDKSKLMESENSELKSKVRDLESQLDNARSAASSSQKYAESLALQMETLTVNNQTLKMKYDSLCKESSDRAEEADKMTVQRAQALLEKSIMEDQLNGSIAKLKLAEVDLDSKQESLDKSEMQIRQLLQSIGLLENQFKSQKTEIKDLIDERNKMTALIRQQSSVIQQADHLLSLSRDEVKVLKKSIKKMEKTYMEKLNKSNYDEIPVTAWYSPDFPKELNNILSDYAKNEALESPVKLKYVLSTIAKYFNNLIKSNESNMRDQLNSINKREDIINHFLTSISQQFNTENLTVEKLLENPFMAHEIIGNVAKLNDENYQLMNNNKTIEENYRNLLSFLDVNTFDDARKTVMSLINQIQTLKNNLQTLKDYANSKIKQHKGTERELTMHIEELRKEVDNNSDEISQLSARNKSLIKENRDKDLELQQLTSSMTKLQRQIDDNLKKYQYDLKKVSDEFSLKLETEMTEKNKLKNRLEDEQRDLKNRITGLTREVQQWKRNSEMNQNVKREKENQLKLVLEQLELTQKEMRDKYSKEKELIKQQYEHALLEVKNRNKELFNAHKELSTQLTEQTNRANEAYEKYAQISTAHDELLVLIDSTKEDSLREKQLLEMKYKHNLLSNEMKYNTLVEDLKSQFTVEKQKIIGFVAQSFRQFFDASSELDENCFKSIVLTAKKELERLSLQELTLRRILGLSLGMSIEETVSKLVLPTISNVNN